MLAPGLGVSLHRRLKIQGKGKEKTMNKKLIILVCVLLSMFALSTGILAETPAAWDGTTDTAWYNKTDTTFEIKDAKQLAGLSAITNGTAAGIAKDTFAGKTVTLTADIDLGGVKADNGTWGGKKWTPVGSFAGVFDGDGHHISNLYVNAANNAGLFGTVNGSGKIRNLNILSGSVTGKAYTGSIAGSVAQNAVIINCSNLAAVSGTNNVGGVVGRMGSNTGYLLNCYNGGTVTASSYGCGGVVGTLSCNGLNLYNTGAISTSYGNGRVGGIIGDIGGNPVTVANCYSAAPSITLTASKVLVTATVGGIAGRPYQSSFQNFYATYKNCYYTSLGDKVFAMGGESSDRAGSAKVAAEDLKSLSVELGEGFAADEANVNNGYPVLKWQNKVDGKYSYDPDEGEGLKIDAETGIFDATNEGFSVKMDRLLVYTRLGLSDFTVSAKVKGETTALNNLQLTLSDDGESTVVTFSFLPLAAETDAEYSVKFKTDDAVTLFFTTPASDWWNGYAAESYDGGSGSATDPYRIATKEQLALFDLSTDKYDNKYFVLTTDLDMSGKYWKAKSFNGHLDGKGHTIRNLTIKGSDVANYAGFISQTTAPVVTYLQNINFESPVLDCTANYAGILAGYTMDTCIENCHVYNGKISSATNVGGLVGMLGSQKAKSGTAYVERCSFSGDMEGTTAAGLISSVYFSNATRAGYVEINDCYAVGNVTATESGSGLIKAISYMQGVTVEHCYSAATVVSGTLDDCGGLVSGVSYSSAKAIADKGLVLKNNVAANPSIITAKTGWNSSTKIMAAPMLLLSSLS